MSFFLECGGRSFRIVFLFVVYYVVICVTVLCSTVIDMGGFCQIFGRVTILFMKIVCIGGGFVGLYLGIFFRKMDFLHEIIVYE